MIFGIGIDLVNVAHFKKIAYCTPRLLTRVFTERERKYCQKNRDSFLHYAARFAAKEAFVKAWGKTIPPDQIEIQIDSDGRPILAVHGRTSQLIQKSKIKRKIVSLSHEDQFAIAIVILEK